MFPSPAGAGKAVWHCKHSHRKRRPPVPWACWSLPKRTYECRRFPAHRPTIIGRSCHKYHFCRDIFVVTFLSHHKVLSRQTPVCRNKTGLLSRQKYGCCDKTFVETKYFYLSRQNMSFVAIKLWKYNFCRDKGFVAINMCLSRQMFVGTNVILSRHTRVCRDKNYTCGSSRQWQPTSHSYLYCLFFHFPRWMCLG